jgi:hypothetical protein
MAETRDDPAGEGEDREEAWEERSGEDPVVGEKFTDEEGRLHIRREIPDDPDEGRLGGPDVH